MMITLKEISISCFITFILVCGLYQAAADYKMQMVEYRVTLGVGDTVWDVCSEIVSSKDDLSEVVWRACRESGISDARLIQPGKEIVVKVKQLKAE